MTIPTAIITLLTAARVPYDAEEIHYALREHNVTLHLIRDTLRLLAERGEVEETKEGWRLRAKPVAIKQGSLFG